MIKSIYIKFFFLLLCFYPYTYSHAEDISLGTIIAPKPKVLGFYFEDSLASVDASVREMGLISIQDKNPLKKPHLKRLVFAGLPKGLLISHDTSKTPIQDKFSLPEGQSEFIFFNNLLIRMDYFFPPSYENFLLIHGQLMHSLGDRFQLSEKKEAMDNFLKAHLADLRSKEYDDRTEKEIIDAIKRGHTFFYYVLDDNKNEMTVTLSFMAERNKYNERKPTLLLHYSSNEGLKRLAQYEEEERVKILPE